MARNFRRHRAAQPISDLNVTNLIDLAFILLVVFMIATPLIQQEQTIPVNLPTVSKSQQTKVDKDDRFVAVAVDANGNFYFRNQLVTPNNLVPRLRAAVAGCSEIRRIVCQNRVHRLHGRVADKRTPAREQFVQDDTETENVGAAVSLVAADLLGRHIADGTEYGAGGSHRLKTRGIRLCRAARGPPQQCGCLDDPKSCPECGAGLGLESRGLLHSSRACTQ